MRSDIPVEYIRDLLAQTKSGEVTWDCFPNPCDSRQWNFNESTPSIIETRRWHTGCLGGSGMDSLGRESHYLWLDIRDDALGAKLPTDFTNADDYEYAEWLDPLLDLFSWIVENGTFDPPVDNHVFAFVVDGVRRGTTARVQFKADLLGESPSPQRLEMWRIAAAHEKGMEKIEALFREMKELLREFGG
jgi:hypothetical protein